MSTNSLRNALPRRAGLTVLRLMQAEDVDAFRAYRADPELARYQGWSTMTADEAHAFVREMSAIESLVPGDWVQLAIGHAETQALIGDVGLHLDTQSEQAEIGFTLCKAAHGAGHATRAVRLTVDLVFEVSPVTRIRAVTDARNLASMAVLQRAGFSKVDQRRVEFKGEECEEFIFVRRRGVTERP